MFMKLMHTNQIDEQIMNTHANNQIDDQIVNTQVD